jgi:cell division septation protein DedD
MDSDNQTLRWSLITVGIVIVCFFLGYFILSPKSAEPQTSPSTTPSSNTLATAPPQKLATESIDNSLKIVDITAEKEAERKKLAEEKKRKEQEALLAQPTPEPIPAVAPEATPKPKETDEKPTPEPDATPDIDKTVSTEPEATPTPAPETDKKPTPEPGTEGKSLFRVRVGGSFSSQDDAKALTEELRGKSISSVIKADQRGGKTIYFVQIGAYSDKKSADRAKLMLESNGYDATIH